jgi:hypothetical protein
MTAPPRGLKSPRYIRLESPRYIRLKNPRYIRLKSLRYIRLESPRYIRVGTPPGPGTKTSKVVTWATPLTTND